MGGWGASPLARWRVTFPGGEFYWIWIDIFKCAPRWKEKEAKARDRRKLLHYA